MKFTRDKVVSKGDEICSYWDCFNKKYQRRTRATYYLLITTYYFLIQLLLSFLATTFLFTYYFLIYLLLIYLLLSSALCRTKTFGTLFLAKFLTLDFIGIMLYSPFFYTWLSESSLNEVCRAQTTIVLSLARRKSSETKSTILLNTFPNLLCLWIECLFFFIMVVSYPLIQTLYLIW